MAILSRGPPPPESIPALTGIFCCRALTVQLAKYWHLFSHPFSSFAVQINDLLSEAPPVRDNIYLISSGHTSIFHFGATARNFGERRTQADKRDLSLHLILLSPYFEYLTSYTSIRDWLWEGKRLKFARSLYVFCRRAELAPKKKKGLIGHPQDERNRNVTFLKVGPPFKHGLSSSVMLQSIYWPRNRGKQVWWRRPGNYRYFVPQMCRSSYFLRPARRSNSQARSWIVR